MTLYVTRHGETDYNVQKRYTGSTDIPLNATGLEQARGLAKNLDMDFDIIVSSPLLRARQTAEIISESLGVPVQAIDEFAETCVGVYEGLTREEVQEKYPDEWSRLAAAWAKNDARPIDDAPTGGETLIQFDTRIAAGISKLRAEYGGKKVLLVCHAFTSRVINRQLTGLSFADMDAFTLANCEIVSYSI